jgi:single-strand DNA-binding protein
MNGIQAYAEARVGNDPELREVSGTPVCNVSLAVTERKQNKQTGNWEDGGTTWLRGAVWGAMAANVASSISKGMLVNVAGILSERTYTTNEGAERKQLELRVDMISPSLRFATAQVMPNDRNGGGGGRPQQQQPVQQWSPGAPTQAPWQTPGAQQPQAPAQQQPQPQQWQQPQQQPAPQQAPAQPFRGPGAPSAQPNQQWATPAYQDDNTPF